MKVPMRRRGHAATVVALMRSHTPAKLLGVVACSMLLAACGSSGSSTSSSSTAASSSAATTPPTSATPTGTTSDQATIGFEGVPIESGPVLAPAGTTGTANVDGIQCGATEQLAYHIHAHLAVFVDGKQYALPGGIGIPGSAIYQTPRGPVAAGGKCIYWLHTHAPDGIIHVESPTQRIYTLGNFFDEWRQPLSATSVGTVKGKLTAFVNGKVWTRNIRDIPLVAHADIQLDTGSPTPPLQKVDWAQTQL
jgi:hypothetical protein